MKKSRSPTDNNNSKNMKRMLHITGAGPLIIFIVLGLALDMFDMSANTWFFCKKIEATCLAFSPIVEAPVLLALAISKIYK